MRLRTLALLLFLPTASFAHTALDFGEGWQNTGKDTKVETYLGANALRLRSGRAFRRDVRFQDGTIEVDVAVTGDRSFFYVQLRMESDTDHEEFYFRPHKSALPDAIQYTPVYFGDGNWQLYHGKGGTAAAEFPRNEWIHIKIVVSGSKAAVFVGDSKEPQLVVPKLSRKEAPGYIALRGFLPQGQPKGSTPRASPTSSFARMKSTTTSPRPRRRRTATKASSPNGSSPTPTSLPTGRCES